MNTDKISSSYEDLVKEGKELFENKQYKEAIKVYKIALLMAKKLDSVTLASMYIRLANSYYNLDDKDKYTYYYEEYLKEYPEGQASVFSRLAHSYYYLDCDKTIDYSNKSLNLQPSQYDVSSKIFAMTKSASYDQIDIKDEAEMEVVRLKSTIFKNIKKYNHDNKKNQKNKKLNIGYLSSDCRAHTMMNYIIPIWENHNQSEFNFCIFNTSSKKDSTTERIEKTGIEMLSFESISAEELAKKIYEKDIDILIDLGGYTHLKSFVSLYKPAPIIISYLGFLNTMGIKEVDYILADKYIIPEDKAYLYTEKPLYLESSAGYQIFMEKKFPDVTDCPFKTNGYITFGSFNCTSKINDATIYLWQKILKEVPDSKLLIYRTQMTKRNIKYLKDKFIKRGIDTERVMFSAQKYDVHFKAYSLADIALDPYPFSGMSICIESMHMGVPTITLVGEGMQSRGAGRVNNLLNYKEFIAECGDDYVMNAVKLANDKEKLAKLRYSLRNEINNSPIKVNFKEFTKDLESKYKKVWENFINSH